MFTVNCRSMSYVLALDYLIIVNFKLPTDLVLLTPDF